MSNNNDEKIINLLKDLSPIYKKHIYQEILFLSEMDKHGNKIEPNLLSNELSWLSRKLLDHLFDTLDFLQRHVMNLTWKTGGPSRVISSDPQEFLSYMLENVLKFQIIDEDEIAHVIFIDPDQIRWAKDIRNILAHSYDFSTRLDEDKVEALKDAYIGLKELKCLPYRGFEFMFRIVKRLCAILEYDIDFLEDEARIRSEKHAEETRPIMVVDTIRNIKEMNREILPTVRRVVMLTGKDKYKSYWFLSYKGSNVRFNNREKAILVSLRNIICLWVPRNMLPALQIPSIIENTKKQLESLPSMPADWWTTLQ